MKAILMTIAGIIIFWAIWYYFQEEKKAIGDYTVYYYAKRCNPDELSSNFSQLTQTPCVKKITWVEQIGPKIYQHMTWTPEIGTKESGLERK